MIARPQLSVAYPNAASQPFGFWVKFRERRQFGIQAFELSYA